jgi:DHA3 family tetracycline resistance protein-like MFS transporter
LTIHAFRRVALLRALAHRPFALLWAGQTISRLGDAILAIALAWWVLEETGSAAAMGTVLAVRTVPELVFLLVGGVAVDRFSRLGVMLLADVLRAAIVGLLAALAWADALTLAHVLAASALFGAVTAFFYPAYQAVIPDLLPAEALTSANSLRGLGNRAMGLVGPAVGAAIVATGGPALAFALDGLSFAVSALFLLGLARTPALGHASIRGEGIVQDLREGIGFVVGTPWLGIPIAIAGVTNLTLAGPLYAALPLLVKEHFGGGVGTLALFEGLLAAGAVVAAVWIGRRASLRRRGLLAFGAWILAALLMATLGLPIGVPGAAVAILCYGAAEAVLALAWLNALQEHVPRRQFGRVASIDQLGSSALAPVGFALAGLAADRFGAANVFLAGGLVSAAIIASGLLHPAVRRLD